MFFTNFETLCKKNNTSATTVVKALGLSSSTVTTWKSGKLPNCDTLLKLAHHLNTTPDHLLLGNQTKSDLDESEKKWLELYHQLSDHDKVECVGFVKGYLAASQNKN